MLWGTLWQPCMCVHIFLCEGACHCWWPWTTSFLSQCTIWAAAAASLKNPQTRSYGFLQNPLIPLWLFFFLFIGQRTKTKYFCHLLNVCDTFQTSENEENVAKTSACFLPQHFLVCVHSHGKILPVALNVCQLVERSQEHENKNVSICSCPLKTASDNWTNCTQL